MELPALQYHRPGSLAQACALGRELGESARFLAGGTDLLVDLKQRRVQVQHVVALDGLGELKRIRVEGGMIRIGALATLTDVAESAAVVEHAPGLAEAILTMAAVQIRNRATIGGNFCAAVPCADTPPMCIAYGGSVTIVSSTGDRVVPAEAFFRLPRRSVLEPGELLADVLLPLRKPGRGAAYARFSRRRSMSLAVAAVAARVDLDGGRVREARVAMTSVAPTPMIASEAGAMLAGQEPTDDVIQRAARCAASEARPISDLRGSAEYRRDLVEVLAVRALRSSIERARNSSGA